MEEAVFKAIFISLHVSILATIVSLLFSLPIGVILAVKNFPLKNLVLAIINAFTAIPPVCAGLVCYLIVSRTGPLGWMGILYTPIAMMIAQFIIITPIMISLITRNIQEEYHFFKEELRSYGAKLFDIIKLLLMNKYKIYFTISIIGFGRAISEYGAAAMVGGSIDHITRNITSTIALETAKGNLYLALQLGMILIVISFVITFLFQIKNKN
jgi:tungstate transport system permease protein